MCVYYISMFHCDTSVHMNVCVKANTSTIQVSYYYWLFYICFSLGGCIEIKGFKEGFMDEKRKEKEKS